MADFEIKLTDNSGQIIQNLSEKIALSLELCGVQAEAHAKHNITSAGRIDTGAMRNSVTHTVSGNTVYIGSSLPYAIFNELGTGIYASQPGGRQTPWYYYDRNGVLHKTVGLKPIHFLRNAVADHISDYKKIIENTLKNY